MDTPNEIVDFIVEFVLQVRLEAGEYEPIGALFIVGDTKRVLRFSHPSGVDPFHGYDREMRDLRLPRVREDAKELAKLDGAFIVDFDGVIQRSRQMLEIFGDDVMESGGLGSRHWAARRATLCSQAVAIVLSRSTGTVRVYKNGDVITRIDPIEE